MDFFAEKAGNPREFVSPGVTIDCNESLRLKVGDWLYSNLYNPMFSLLSDDVGEHDLLHPCCRPEMFEFFYHNGAGHPNCLDNINASLGEDRPIIRRVLTKSTPFGKMKFSFFRVASFSCHLR